MLTSRKTSSLRSDLLAGLLSVGLSLGLAACAPPAEEAAAPAADPTAEIVRNVEANLQPQVLVEGRDQPPQSLAQRMEHYGVPAVSVAVIDGGEVAWTRAWGLADVESGRPATPETLFQAASISKPVAALGALALVERGQLDLDADVHEKLRGWNVPEHDFEGAVTLRGLASHTAGLSVHGFPGYGPEEEVPSTVGVLKGEGNTDPVEVVLAPGTEFRYSGGGYTVLQLLVEEAAGAPFDEVMQETVLATLGMSRSTYAQPLPEALRAQAATAYERDGSAVEGRFHTYPEMAAAGLWTTPKDLARFAIALQKGLAGEGHPLLSAERVEEMTTPVLGTYGLGWAIQEELGFFAHGGSNAGYRCVLTASLEGGHGVVVMTNSDQGGALADEIVLTVAREYGWPGPKPQTKTLHPLSEEDLAAIAGTYEGERGDVTLTLQDGVLWATASWDEGLKLQLLPEAEDTFFSLDDGMQVKVVRDEAGKVDRLEAVESVYRRVE